MRESGLPTITEREAQRQEIAKQVNEFLEKGGRIDCLEQPNVAIRPIGSVATPIIGNLIG